MPRSLLEKLDRILALPKENEWVEFKHNYHSAEEIGTLISGLSNTASLLNRLVAYLVFGVADGTHEVVGTIFSPAKTKVGNEELEHWLAQRLNPRIDFRIYELEHCGKSVVVFEIPAAELRPVDFMHVAYIRVGSINRRLGDFPEKERKIWSSSIDFELSTAKQGCSADDVVRLLDTHVYFERLNLPYPSTRERVIERLLSDGLISDIADDGYIITNTAAILLAKDLGAFPTVSRKIIRVVQYEGANKLRTLRDSEFVEGYAVCFPRLVKYVNDLLPRRESIGQALRTEVSMYPELAIRELIANCLVHQDFTISGTASMIEIFADRIEFSNPGESLIDTSRFIDGYRSRNEKIASLMRRFGVCEEKGSGIDKVVVSCEVAQLPAPLFDIPPGRTRVVLYAHKQLRQMNRDEKIRAIYQHACIKWIENEAMTNQSLRQRLEIADHNYSFVSRLIREALKEGVIKEADSDSKSKKFARYLPFWA